LLHPGPMSMTPELPVLSVKRRRRPNDERHKRPGAATQAETLVLRARAPVPTWWCLALASAMKSVGKPRRPVGRTECGYMRIVVRS
jgi:hypothetical protein